MHISTPTIRRTAIRACAVAGLAFAAFGVQSASTAPPSAPSSIVTIDPARILDTRTPLGVPSAGPVGPGETVTLQVAGAGGVPLGATGVVLTLTATDATINTFITATPTGTPRSTTSVLNPLVGTAIANTVTMSLGTNGRIDLFNPAGRVHLIADVTGYLLPAPGQGLVTESIELSAYSGMGTGIGLPGDFGCVDLSDNGTIYLDVPLPHGAAISRVDFRWFDDDNANIEMFVTEVDNPGPFGTPSQGNLLGNTIASTGTIGYGTSSVTISGADPVSSNVRYHIVALTLGQANISTLHRFCGATVTYSRIVD